VRPTSGTFWAYDSQSPMIFRKSAVKPVESTPFSDFIRNASSEDKKRVYRQVLERQNRLLAQSVKAK
jgi:hypothetical protein